jgi:hypothetical protein
MYGYDGEGAHVAELVDIFGRTKKDGFRTPRIGAVSNSAKGVLTIFDGMPKGGMKEGYKRDNVSHKMTASALGGRERSGVRIKGNF